MKLFTGLALSLLLCTAVVSVVKADDDDLGSRAFVLVQKSVNTPEEIKHSEGYTEECLSAIQECDGYYHREQCWWIGCQRRAS